MTRVFFRNFTDRSPAPESGPILPETAYEPAFQQGANTSPHETQWLHVNAFGRHIEQDHCAGAQPQLAGNQPSHASRCIGRAADWAMKFVLGGDGISRLHID